MALVLESNPCLSARDIQHMIVHTSNRNGLLTKWTRNGAGHYVSADYGFGRLSPLGLVEAAANWSTVAPSLQQMYNGPVQRSRMLASESSLIQELFLPDCTGNPSCIAHLEHVQVKIDLKARNRGRLSISLISPSNTPSVLLSPRRNDDNFDIHWTLTTTRLWDESPSGLWRLIVSSTEPGEVLLEHWQLILLGTGADSWYQDAPITNQTLKQVGRHSERTCLFCDENSFADGQGQCRSCHPECDLGCFGPGKASCQRPPPVPMVSLMAPHAWVVTLVIGGVFGMILAKAFVALATLGQEVELNIEQESLLQPQKRKRSILDIQPMLR